MQAAHTTTPVVTSLGTFPTLSTLGGCIYPLAGYIDQNEHSMPLQWTWTNMQIEGSPFYSL